ncbi:MAG: hypothetical protein FWF00_00945 [Endomicrobia bacterium]|nr:hypothetical protein [Endomicrobiia bacterium]MCL2506241.1 hypothetical protein [Endomicrobiia bacterium]
MKKLLISLFILAFCAGGLFAAFKKPGDIRERVSVPSAKTIENAIRKACSIHNLKAVKLDGHNVIFVTTETDECILTVRITYTDTNYIIEYRESNLDEEDEEDNQIIRKVYTNKITELNNAILKNIRNDAVATPAPIKEEVSASSADAIEKAIYKSCKEDNWATRKVKDKNVILAFLDDERSALVLNIAYTDKDYTIEYRESNFNLAEVNSKSIIDVIYETRVADLNKRILKNLGK